MRCRTFSIDLIHTTSLGSMRLRSREDHGTEQSVQHLVHDITAGQVSACSRMSALSTSSTCRKLHRKIRGNPVFFHNIKDDIITDDFLKAN